MGEFGDVFPVLLLVVLPAVAATVLGRMLLRWWWQRRRERPRAGFNRRWRSPLLDEETVLENAARTPEEIVMLELRQARVLYEAGRVQEFVESIALLVKRNVSNHYGVKVADATTSQILAHLPQSLSEGVADHVGEILHTCDALTFARHRPSRGDLDRLYRSAVEFFQIYGSREIAVEPSVEEDVEDVEDVEDLDEAEDELREILRRYFPG